jgi:uncharacterized protein YcaQ
MVARREKFQRIYDLRERILPDWDDHNTPSREEMIHTQTLRTVKLMGAAAPGWVADYFRLSKAETLKALEELAQSGEIWSCLLEGDKPQKVYYHPDNAGLISAAAEGKLLPQRTTLLSPFDPLVWDRKRTLQSFQFDFALECYLPASKRKYGYFSLPLLYHDRFAGRVEARALRKEKIFEIISIYLEPDFSMDDEFIAETAAALNDCARWHKTPKVTILLTDPPKLKDALSSRVKAG